jgi:heme/copper-type cytochrome/quinol oxidase subunit 3
MKLLGVKYVKHLQKLEEQWHMYTQELNDGRLWLREVVMAAIYSHTFFFFFFFFFFFYSATARGKPWPPLQYVSKPLDPLLYLSLRLVPSFSGP